MLAVAGKRLTGIPESLLGLPIDTVQSWSRAVPAGRRSHQSSYLRRFITEAASGAHTCRLPWRSELGSWSSAPQALDPFLLRQVLFVSGSARLSHMPDMSYSRARVLAIWAWGMTTDCFGLQRAQPAARGSPGYITMV